VYTDVHTTLRVSPAGLVRGAISELNCPFPTASAPSTPASPTPSPPSPTPAPTNPATPPTAGSPPLSNPCYCSPQTGVGSDGYQYCFNFDRDTTNVNCTPPQGANCQVLTLGGFSNAPGPVFQCSY
jgi:hypothetical protein